MKNGTKKLNVILLLIAFVFTAFAIVKGSYINDTEVVKVGMVSTKRYVATRDVVDRNATERLKQEARESVGPLYTLDEGVMEDSIGDIKVFFDNLDDTFVQSEEDGGVFTIPSKSSLNIPVALTAEQYYTYYLLSDTAREALKNDICDITEFVFGQGITDETMGKALALSVEEIEEYGLPVNEASLAQSIISAVLKPNLVPDEEAMELAMAHRESLVEPRMVLNGQKIVDEGEVITQDIYDLLDDLNLINIDYSSGSVPIAAAIVLTAIVFIAMAIYMKGQYRGLLDKSSTSAIVFASYILTIGMLFVLSDFAQYYMIPLYIFPVLVSIMVGAKVAVVLNIFMCIGSTFIFNGGVDFLLFFVVTGSFLALIVRYTRRRRNIITVSLGAAAVSFVSIVAVKLFVEGGYSTELIMIGVYSAIVTVITIMLAIGSLPVWEAVFKIDTPYKLMEFTNPNNELLKRLMIEAPGTYHHSLIVANLAETAAYDVFADGTLARAGAYYHDIGKLHNPQCFAENQNGKNVHDTLSPEESARLILEHAIYGMELAKEHKLPNVIKDFICQHHGTSLIKFFYFKASKENGEADEADYRYPGPIPQTKESAIVMLADTVEAAVRSVISSGKSHDEVEQMIDNLIKDKLNDGQLDDCGLNLKELRQIKASFMKVFNGMYHDRIVYPDEEEIKKVRKK